MITPSFSPTATERVLPKLALDFTTASLDPRVTFTRTTDATHPATYVNSNGYVTAATNNQPRFDCDPITLACKGLLIEESRTNKLTNSTNITVTGGWNTLNAASTASAGTSPDGTNNAFKIYESTTSSGAHAFYKQNLNTSGTAATVTAFLKAGERTWAAISDTIAFTAYVNLATGQFGTISGAYTGATITPFGNGWYRVSLSFVSTSNTSGLGIYTANGDGAVTYSGTIGYGIYAYGPQCETGAFPTSYIPTTTTALTRNADVATMTGTNFSDWFNFSQSTFFTSYSLLGNNPVFNYVFIASDGTTDNRIQFGKTPTQLQTYSAVGGSGTGLVYTNNNTLNATVNTCFNYKTNNSNLGINSVLGTPAGAFTAPSSGINKMSLGCNWDGTGYYLNGYLKKFEYWNIYTTNAEVQAFSK